MSPITRQYRPAPAPLLRAGLPVTILLAALLVVPGILAAAVTPTRDHTTRTEPENSRERGHERNDEHRTAMLMGIHAGLLYTGGNDNVPRGIAPEAAAAITTFSFPPSNWLFTSARLGITPFHNASYLDRYAYDDEAICRERESGSEAYSSRCNYIFNQPEIFGTFEGGIYLTGLHPRLHVGVGAGYRIPGSLSGFYATVTLLNGLVQVRGNHEYLSAGISIPVGISYH
ncbi:hypothetical protein [Spirochaeta africana]|uniref:Uncharacterized protein n=1 Tax=Spirochaeta africana (strain ATCC 700263 / DSM 8902 / Z-7692) TaxID=889378 RepID=H9UK97_SPIAZ|nr:hypothetical protein [Spirochaeta africana]AFG37940.1 hypothetical protein Spiaf_1886 [Spirochaeta africana DSM 8902]